MTDEPHMDETRPDQTRAEGERPEPKGFGDLPMQPTGSGVADEQMAYDEAERDAAPEGTAGYGNTGAPEPAIEGGQAAVGEPDGRQTRNTEF